MRSGICTGLLVGVLLTICFPSHGSSQSKAPADKKSQEKPLDKPAEAAVRRQTALDLLKECADSLPSVADNFYRARIPALVGQNYWAIDKEAARALFLKAWEEAKKSDAADLEHAVNDGGSRDTRLYTEARKDVLEIVAQKDKTLFDTMLSAFQNPGDNDPDSFGSTASGTADAWHSESYVDQQRLLLASETLAEGNADLAFQIASPLAVNGARSGLISFVIELRTVDANRADGLLVQIAQQTAADPNADVNSALLLTAPVVSPRMLAVVDSTGSLIFRALPMPSAPGKLSPPISPAVLNAVFGTGGQILLRPQPAVAGNGNAMNGALYYATTRLLPYIDQYAPQIGPALHAKQNDISNALDAGRRSQLGDQAGLKSVSTDSVDPLRPDYDSMSHATDSATKDRLALAFIRTAARNRIWDRARRTAEQINDLQLREAARQFVAVSEISNILRTYASDKDNDYVPLVNYLQKTNVPPFATAWGYAQTAEIAYKRDGAAKAADLISAGETFATQTAPGSRERLVAYASLLLAATRVAKKDAPRLLVEVVHTANALEDLNGDEDSLSFHFGNSTTAGDLIIDVSGVSLETVFRAMARTDVKEAIAEAHAIDRTTARILCLNAIAGSLVEK